MQIKLIMLCEGGFQLPQINHAVVNDDTLEQASKELQSVVEKLYPIGYRRFVVYDVGTDGEHKQVGNFVYTATNPTIDFLEK